MKFKKEKNNLHQKKMVCLPLTLKKKRKEKQNEGYMFATYF